MDISRDSHVGICGLVNQVLCRTLVAVVIFVLVYMERRILGGGFRLLALAAPFLYPAGLVVRSFYVPVPVPTSHTSGDWSGLVGILMVIVCGMSHYCHTIEVCIYGFSLVAGLLAAVQLSWPPKDVSVQQVVYTDFLLCLVAYLGYQRPFWLACVFVAALILVNTLLFQGLLCLHTKPLEEDKSLVSDLNVQVYLGISFASFSISYHLASYQ